jgi:(1->4)-alpha-D-glucan 1-alpha-D-glucosylmutase
MRLNRGRRTLIDGEPAPDRNDEYRFYQALVGCWPAEGADGDQAPPELVSRLQEYMLKAAREGKLHTSWLTPNQQYEDALQSFVERVLTGDGGRRFLAAMRPLQQRIATIGVMNSLSQVAAKLGSPGVPDVYQGADLWDLSLVDPDNRRPVDFAHRQRLLDDVDRVLSLSPAERPPAIAGMLTNWRDGRIKLLVTAAGLRLRREKPELFLSGGYLPLETEVTVAGGAFAFARVRGDEGALFVLPRLCARLIDAGLRPPLGDAWKTSRVLIPQELVGRRFRDEITGVELRPTSTADQTWLFLGQLFGHVPVGILRAV